MNLFTVRCVVSQAWARLYQNFTMIPNVVPEIYGCQDLDLNLKQVMFTPSHGKGGRFGFKGADKTERIINKFYKSYKSFSRNTTKEGVNIIINKQPIRQSSLHVLRSHTHVSIDEIVTGGFHQVSLEALATGGCVINGADIFSLMNFAHSVEAEELPPFITVKDEAEFRRALFQITHDHDFLLDAILQSRKYYKNFLTTRRLGGLIQKKVLDLL